VLFSCQCELGYFVLHLPFLCARRLNKAHVLSFSEMFLFQGDRRGGLRIHQPGQIPWYCREIFPQRCCEGGLPFFSFLFLLSDILFSLKVLMEPLTPKDVEIKPDGIIYLPEIKYRRILNQAFGPGGWAMVPMRESIVKGTVLNRGGFLVALQIFSHSLQITCCFVLEDLWLKPKENIGLSPLRKCRKELQKKVPNQML